MSLKYECGSQVAYTFHYVWGTYNKLILDFQFNFLSFLIEVKDIYKLGI